MKIPFKYYSFWSLIIFVLLSVYFMSNIIFDYLSHDKMKGIYFFPIFHNQMLFIAGALLIPIMGIVSFVLMLWRKEEKLHLVTDLYDELILAEKALKYQDEVEETQITLEEKIDNIINTADQSSEEKYEACFFALNKYLDTVAGVLYIRNRAQNKVVFQSKSLYMLNTFKKQIDFEIGEGIIGEVAQQGTTRIIWDVPGEEISLQSGLGNAVPHVLVIHPVIDQSIGEVECIGEFAFFEPLNKSVIKNIENLMSVFNDKTRSLVLMHSNI